jgi:hypothetical protein
MTKVDEILKTQQNFEKVQHQRYTNLSNKDKKIWDLFEAGVTNEMFQNNWPSYCAPGESQRKFLTRVTTVIKEMTAPTINFHDDMILNYEIFKMNIAGANDDVYIVRVTYRSKEKVKMYETDSKEFLKAAIQLLNGQMREEMNKAVEGIKKSALSLNDQDIYDKITTREKLLTKTEKLLGCKKITSYDEKELNNLYKLTGLKLGKLTSFKDFYSKPNDDKNNIKIVEEVLANQKVREKK